MVSVLSPRRGSKAAFRHRLTFSTIRGLLVALVIIHIIVLWRAMGGGESMNNAAKYIDFTPPKSGPTVIPFVVSMTGCGEDPFLEGVSAAASWVDG